VAKLTRSFAGLCLTSRATPYFEEGVLPLELLLPVPLGGVAGVVELEPLELLFPEPVAPEEELVDVLELLFPVVLELDPLELLLPVPTLPEPLVLLLPVPVPPDGEVLEEGLVAELLFPLFVSVP
jgi:hypothetical protein